MTCGIVLAAPELPVRYDAHKIVRVPRELQRELKGVDVWSYGKDYVEVRVSPKDYERLKQQSSKIVVVENNIQKLIDSERHEFSEWQEDDDYFNNYHTVQEMFRWSRQLQTKYPQLVKMVPSIGKSVQGRDLWAMRITSPNKATKRQVWIQSLLHAREWISGAAGQYVSQALAEGYGRDEAITDILDKVEFVFVPLSNPDGYAYSWAKDRLWRKNRAVFNGSADGVDLNRNFPDHWGVGLASNDTKDETYMGPHPLSEPEVRALTSYYQTLNDVVGALDFHSYTQLLLRPYGWTESPAPLEIELNFAKVSSEMLKGIKKVNSTTEYLSIPASQLYVASGAADDWWNGEATPKGHRMPYGMTIELSPSSFWEGGFVLPARRIKGVGEEMVEAVKRFVVYALANPLPIKE